MRFGSRGPSGYGNVYRSVREKQGIVVYRQRVLQTVTSLGVVSLVFRRHDLLKIANFNPQQEARFSLWKKLVPRMRLVAEMESRCKGIIMNISYLKLRTKIKYYCKVKPIILASSCHVFLSDRFVPVLVKSLRSQRVRQVTAGEYHTAVLAEVSVQKEACSLQH